MLTTRSFMHVPIKVSACVGLLCAAAALYSSATGCAYVFQLQMAAMYLTPIALMYAAYGVVLSTGKKGEGHVCWLHQTEIHAHPNGSDTHYACRCGRTDVERYRF